MWVFNSFNNIYSFDSAALSWNAVAGRELNVSAIHAAFDGAAWAVDVNGFPYRFDPQLEDFVYEYTFVDARGFSTMGVSSIAVGAAAVVWGVNAFSGIVYQYW